MSDEQNTLLHPVNRPVDGVSVQDPAIAEAAPVEEVDKAILRKTVWSRFGGDGFLISLGLHIILILIGIYWVISTFVVNADKPENNTFATGAGGGSGGDQAKIFEHRIKPKHVQSMVSTPAKLTVAGGTGVSLPDMPDMDMSSMMAGSVMGGSSKGAGGGSGGGIGTGKGMGIGGGKNFVAPPGLFGSGFGSQAGLIGTFYDLKQDVSGKETKMAGSDNESKQAYVDKVREFVQRGFRDLALKDFFKSPTKLVTTQIFFPSMRAEKAPNAFEVPQVQASRWVVHYSGAVRAPKSGSIRFVGTGDDILAVRLRRQIVLDAGHDLVSVTSKDYGGTGHMASHNFVPKNGVANRTTDEESARWGSMGDGGWRVGRWVDVRRGEIYEIDVVIGETPGGSFRAYLLFEEAEENNRRKGNGKLNLFRIGSGPLPEEIANGASGVNCDMSGGGWEWQAVDRTGFGGGIR